MRPIILACIIAIPFHTLNFSSENKLKSFFTDSRVLTAMGTAVVTAGATLWITHRACLEPNNNDSLNERISTLDQEKKSLLENISTLDKVKSSLIEQLSRQDKELKQKNELIKQLTKSAQNSTSDLQPEGEQQQPASPASSSSERLGASS